MKSDNCVLIVDDECDVSFGASVWLRQAGYETITAANGMEGVQAAIDDHPVAIVMDVRMPKMDGLAALDQLQLDARTKDIPIVMLSASLVDQQRALEAGARFFLTKPYSGQELAAAVDAACQRRSFESECEDAELIDAELEDSACDDLECEEAL